MLRSISYLDKHSSAMILCMYILVLMMLPCTTASPGQFNTNCGNKNTNMTLAVTSAVAVASKMNVGSQKHTTISYVSKLNGNNLARRNIRFKKSEKELEKICFSNGVTYEPPKEKETDRQTRNRRKRLDELCSPSNKIKAKQKEAKRRRNPEARQNDAKRKRTPEACQKDATRKQKR